MHDKRTKALKLKMKNENNFPRALVPLIISDYSSRLYSGNCCISSSSKPNTMGCGKNCSCHVRLRLITVGRNWDLGLVTVVSVKFSYFTETTAQCMGMNYKYDSIA